METFDEILEALKENKELATELLEKQLQTKIKVYGFIEELLAVPQNKKDSAMVVAIAELLKNV